MRNRIAVILIFLSWPVCVVHRIWNNVPLANVKWIVFDKTVNQDFRWYCVYSELWISALFVLISFIITRRKTRNLQIALWGVFWVSIVDIFNYWLFFRRNELMLTLEGLIMFVAAIIIFKNDNTASKSNHAKTT